MNTQQEEITTSIKLMLEEALSNVALSPPEDQQAGLVAIYEEMLPITHVEQDLDMRRVLSFMYRDFFRSTAKRLMELVAKQYPDILVMAEFKEDFVRKATAFYERAMSGDFKYLPYLNPEAPQGNSLGVQCVMLRIIVGVGRTLGTGSSNQFVWVITTEHWKTNEDDSDIMDQIATIERD